MVQIQGSPPLPATLPPLLEGLRSGESALPALYFRDGEEWRSESYLELRDAVRALAAGLLAASVEPGDRVAIFADTSPWWTKADFAVALAGGISVPIYPTSTPNQIAWILENSEPCLVLCDGEARLRAVAAAGGAELALAIVASSPEGSLLALGREARDQRLEEALARGGAVRTNDLATIVYTSGTTGNPKGCCISHGNLAAVLAMNLAAERIGPGWVAHRERCYVFLPLAHIAARMHQLISVAVRGELAYGSDGIAAVFADLGRVRPTCLPGVPRLFEKTVALARESGGEEAEAARRLLGDRVSWAISGGAPIEPELVELLFSWGIPLYEGYGMSETSGAIAISTAGAVRAGAVGRPLHGLELRLGGDGGIEVRGPNVFRGYWRNEPATAAAFDGAWFRTGDLGSLDREGFLRVRGRSKDLIATAYGKKVAPAPIENEIRHSPLVANAVVCGEGRPFLVGLLELDSSAGAPEAEVVAAIGRHIATINARRSPPERIRRWAVLPRSLSVERGELTASMKVRRSVVERSFVELLDDLFAGRAGRDAEPARPAAV
jgi:long-chain acyl-CoA synthetase